MSRSFHVAVGAAFITCAFATSFAFAQSQPAAPVCIYNSANYSDGAYICAQRSMMLICQSDGVKATWKVVADKDISDRCTVPLVAPVTREGRSRARRHMIRARIVSSPAETSAKCFNFNGKRYCE